MSTNFGALFGSDPSASGQIIAVSGVKTGAYNIATSDYLVLGNATSGTFAVTLPTAVGIKGQIFAIKRTDQTLANTLQLLTTSSQTIDGVTSRNLSTQYEELWVVSDNANWQILARRIDGVLTSYTPSFTGFGTVTGVSFSWSRIGKHLRVTGTCTSGTVSGVTAQVTLPSGLTVDSSIASTTAVIGQAASNAAGGAMLNILATSGNGFVNFSYYGVVAALTPQTGSALFPSNQSLSFDFLVPITGWEG